MNAKMNAKTKTKKKTHCPPLQLLDNFAYEVYTPPTASALGDEIGRRTVEILERLDFGNSQVLFDQLLYISQITRYPLNTSKAAKKEYDFSWIMESDLDILDWLLSVTIEKKENNKTKIACICATLYWVLTRQDMDLSPYLKSLGLNTTYANFLVSEYLKIFY